MVKSSQSNADSPDVRSGVLVPAMKAVEPFFEHLGQPGPTDWLATFHEPGQTFAEYLKSNPTVPTPERHTIYVLPLGKFKPEQSKAITITAGYLAAFYGLPVKQLPQQPIMRPLPVKDSRTNQISHKTQIRTGYILDNILRPQLPTDAAALIAFTNEDLYPDESMSYVFGQASMENRVGVWSLYRLHDNADFHTFLLRTIKIATHETGHIFSMHHCIAWSCVMSGTNHLGETDSHPIDACPECMAKVCWLSRVSPADRYMKLAAFCRANGLQKEAADFDKKFAAINSL
ncbi:MAG TPA: archaemetzincin [Pyrinomonadaceae bacterium]